MILSGTPIDYLTAFAGGVVLSLSPCVYPLIPVTIGFIGIKAGSSRVKGLFLSLVYVSGIAITYSLLGLFASLSGKIFGQVTSHPLTYIFVGVVIIIFGVSMWDIFSISLPNIIRLKENKKQGYFSAFLLGLTSGLVVGPCLVPVLGSILTFLATKKNILYGATLLFTFAYGMGLVLILCGTFSSLLASLPKSGRWTAYVKKISGFILILAGLYFIITAIRRL